LKHDLESLKAALPNVPAGRWKGRLTRRVEFLALLACNPPNWLYTSGRPNRFNPRGIHCVYFAAAPDIARIEYEDLWQGQQGAGQPATEFNADVDLRRILDLTSTAALKALNIDQDELFVNWRRARNPTLSQLIGQAINETNLFSSIRYYSQAAARKDVAGANIVIFREALRAPEFVHIIGPAKKPLQQWP
jgi:hypothetical protein